MGLEAITIAYIASAVSAAASVAGGVVSYVGAQRQAKALEYQAESAEAQAKVNSQIAYQQRQAQQQDAQYQAGVADLNKNMAVAEFGRKQVAFTNEVEEERASFTNNAFSTQGSFEDIFNSQEKSYNLAAGELAAGYSEKTYQLGSQSNLATESGRRSLELGRYEAQNVLFGGENQATSYRNQAGAARTAGIGSLIGGVAGAAS